MEIGAEYRDFMNGCSEFVLVFVLVTFEFGERGGEGSGKCWILRVFGEGCRLGGED